MQARSQWDDIPKVLKEKKPVSQEFYIQQNYPLKIKARFLCLWRQLRRSSEPLQEEKNEAYLSHLKSLEIVLKAYNKWRDIYSRKPKTQYEQWVCNILAITYSVLLTPVHLDWYDTLGGYGLEVGIPLPSVYNQGFLYLTEGQATSISHLVQLEGEEAKFLVIAAKRLRVLFSILPPPIEWRLYPRHGRLRILGLQLPSPQLAFNFFFLS